MLPPTGADFTAAPSALGYFYQVRYALVVLLQSQNPESRFCCDRLGKQHLREKYRDQRGLVEEFILEFEGAGKNCDVTRWDLFTDIKDIKKEMLKLRSRRDGKPDQRTRAWTIQ